MRTDLSNKLNLTPASGPVTPRVHQMMFVAPARIGGTRSLPAEIGTSRPIGRARPNLAKEHPVEISRSTGRLEPAREPVDATIAAPIAPL